MAKREVVFCERIYKKVGNGCVTDGGAYHNRDRLANEYRFIKALSGLERLTHVEDLEMVLDENDDIVIRGWATTQRFDRVMRFIGDNDYEDIENLFRKSK